jgi:hypothetical protein
MSFALCTFPINGNLNNKQQNDERNKGSNSDDFVVGMSASLENENDCEEWKK